jgi:16S rRNA (uracil1498-N3)-methyltransferase
MTQLYLSDPIQAGAGIVLPEAAARHVRVLRLREGDPVTLFDGSGWVWPAMIALVSKRDVHVDVGARAQGLGYASPEITLALAVIAADRMDWAIQKAVELGVAAIQPVLAERSQGAHFAEKKLLHWQGVAIAAAEQCGRAKIAQFLLPKSVEEVLAAYPAQHAWVCDFDGEVVPAPTSAQSVLVFVGPEGGWTPAERRAFSERSVPRLSLSQATLRAETAAIAAMVRLTQSSLSMD